jgi:hypothetical protein
VSTTGVAMPSTGAFSRNGTSRDRSSPRHEAPPGMELAAVVAGGAKGPEPFAAGGAAPGAGATVFARGGGDAYEDVSAARGSAPGVGCCSHAARGSSGVAGGSGGTATQAGTPARRQKSSRPVTVEVFHAVGRGAKNAGQVRPTSRSARLRWVRRDPVLRLENDEPTARRTVPLVDKTKPVADPTLATTPFFTQQRARRVGGCEGDEWGRDAVVVESERHQLALRVVQILERSRR